MATINTLNLPRYGLGNYVARHAARAADRRPRPKQLAGPVARRQAPDGLLPHEPVQAAGKQRRRLSPVRRAPHSCATSSILHAIEKDLPLPIGTQDAGLLDAGNYDEDIDDESAAAELFDDDDGTSGKPHRCSPCAPTPTSSSARRRSTRSTPRSSRAASSGSRPTCSCRPSRRTSLSDAASSARHSQTLRRLEARCRREARTRSFNLLTKQHPSEKVLVFTQFADTVRYLETQLRARGFSRSRASPGTPTIRPRSPGDSARTATTSATKYRPERRASRPDRHRRAERRPEPSGCVDRRQLRSAVGDHPADPARRPRRSHRPEGREESSAIRSCPPTASSGSSVCAPACASACTRTPRSSARTKRSSRTTTNDNRLLDLYHEKAGILDGDADTEVDLASYAYQIWKNAIDRSPALQKTIPALPPVVYSTRPHAGIRG